DRRRSTSLRRRQRPQAGELRHAQRASPPRLAADPCRLARRVEPRPDERPDRRRAQGCGGRRSHDRGAQEEQPADRNHRDRDGRRCCARAGDPGSDRGADPRRKRARPPHLDRGWSHLRCPPHPHGHDRRRARPPRRAARDRRRVHRPRGDVSRRPRLPERGPRPLSRARSRRRAAGRFCGRLAPRRPRAAGDRENGNRMTGGCFRLPALLLVVAALATPVAAGGGADPVAERGDQRWKKVVPGGDCQCADGSEFAFWERRSDPAKVVLFLNGGGVCYDAASCAFTGLDHPGEEAAYDWSIWGEDPAAEDGIFNFARADNPFRDFSFIYVPSCTGDAHLGDVTRKYSPHLTVEHKGLVNGTAALDYLTENFPDAAQVVVVGKSVGSVAAPVYGGLVADRLPDAQVTVFGAQSGHVPDDPDLNARFFGELWGACDPVPTWGVQGLPAGDWGAPRFWVQAGLHDPEIVLARFDYAYDREAAKGARLLGLDPSNLLAAIDANEAAIEKAGLVLHSFTAPGDGHGILEWPRFYKLKVNGVRLVDWVTRLISGEPVDDVHCQKCRPS